MWTKKEKDVEGGRNSTKHSKIELQHETRPVGALLHQMLPKQPFIRRDGENKKKKRRWSQFHKISKRAFFSLSAFVKRVKRCNTGKHWVTFDEMV